MKIYNEDEHRACYCYNNEENPLVKLIKMKRGDAHDLTLSTNEIAFILEGKVNLASENLVDGELYKGQLVFLQAGSRLYYEAAAKSLVLVLRLTDHIHLCHNFSTQRLYNWIKDEEKPDSPFPLEINARLWHFAEGLIDVWQDGLRCKLYLRAEISRLLNMLPLYYSKDDLSRFFYPILSPDTTFFEYVRTNHLKYFTVGEFASSLNMTPQQFTRRFNNVFGEAPYAWMQRERARAIYERISQSKTMLKEIATEFGFTDQANFNRFCKTFFETTPGKIRKNKA